MWPAVKLGFKQEEFKQYVSGLSWPSWRPTKIVWHNTAAPTDAQWIKSAASDKANGLVPGISRIRSLEEFFKNNNHWSGCPHLFIASDLIWVMNPLTSPGVHSPSWNSTSIGIEMIGDYDVEDDETGVGLMVKNNTIFATAVLCEAIGLEVSDGVVERVMRGNEVVNHKVSGTIFLHKQDWATTHDCPGAHVSQDKAKMIAGVQALMSGGEHNSEDTGAVIGGQAPPPPPAPWKGKTKVGDLNLRRGPGVMNESMGKLPANLLLIVSSEAKNGTTNWLRVTTPAGYTGWVGGSFVERIGT